MNRPIRTTLIRLLTITLLAGCSASPEVQRDPYNSADEQRERARQAQDELSSETNQ